tara:strand:- start:5174 stop:5761 length:588 start_codon:yes stop_codon:yes gene_type:complete
MNTTCKERTYIFSDGDYNSGDGMLTSVWGPGMWHYLHTMSFNYPVKPTKYDKKHYRDFVLQLQYVLPCGKCRENLKKNFKELPLTQGDMESRYTFSKYMYKLHEKVNTLLNKKSGLTYCDVRERYEHFRSRCMKTLKEKYVKNKTKKVRFSKELIKEKGCTEPLYGEKSKCILQIVPENTKCETLQIDEKCIKRK